MLLKIGLKITIWIHLQAISERLQLRGETAGKPIQADPI